MTEEPDIAEAAAAAEDIPDPHDIVGRDEEVPLEELFSDGFVRAHTRFDSFDELVAASPSEAESAAELGRVPDGFWDEFVAATTQFEDEEAMVFAAIDDWVARKLDL